MGVRRVGGAAPSVADYTGDDEAFEAENEDEVPARSSLVQSGWDAARRAQRESAQSSGGYVTDFRFTEDVQLVKFMSAEPIAVYKQHWVQERKGQGRMSFTCAGAKCPLCTKVGHKPQQKIAFSIVNLSAEEPIPQLLSVGVRAAGQLDSLNEGRTGPLDKGYWALSKSGTGTSTTYAFVPVKERDLAEDWDIDPEDAAEVIDGIDPVDDSAIRVDTIDQLNEIAAELS